MKEIDRLGMFVPACADVAATYTEPNISAHLTILSPSSSPHEVQTTLRDIAGRLRAFQAVWFVHNEEVQPHFKAATMYYPLQQSGERIAQMVIALETQFVKVVGRKTNQEERKLFILMATVGHLAQLMHGYFLLTQGMLGVDMFVDRPDN